MLNKANIALSLAIAFGAAGSAAAASRHHIARHPAAVAAAGAYAFGDADFGAASSSPGGYLISPALFRGAHYFAHTGLAGFGGSYAYAPGSAYAYAPGSFGGAAAAYALADSPVAGRRGLMPGGGCWISTSIEHPTQNPNGTFGYGGSCSPIAVPNTRPSSLNAE
jgi:hypothetical protein